MAFIVNTAIPPVRNTSATLISTNDVFEKGRAIFETDTNRGKVGDGVTAYVDLSYPEWTYEEVPVAAGTDTYTATFSEDILLGYFNMMRLRVKFTNANTGASTINLNGLGAKAIRKNVSAVLVSGDILAGGIYELVYDGTNFQLITPTGNSSGIVPAALTKTDDTNVTITLGGSPSISLLAATSLTMGWSGTLATSRGGTGVSSFGGINRILYTTAINTLASSSNFLFNGTELILGGTALLSSELVSIQKNQNSSTFLAVSNSTSGSIASAAVVASNSATLATSIFMISYSAGFTSGGIAVANTGVLRTGNTAGMNIGTTISTQLSLWTNNTKRIIIPPAGGMVIGPSALATNATDGFLYIPTCTGTPTGTPTTQTGTVAMVFDTTNNILYIYDGSWLGLTNPGAFS